MKNLKVLVFSLLILTVGSFSAIGDCGVSTTCGGGVAVTCSGSNCCGNSSGVTCDGATTSCPQR